VTWVAIARLLRVQPRGSKHTMPDVSVLSARHRRAPGY